MKLLLVPAKCTHAGLRHSARRMLALCCILLADRAVPATDYETQIKPILQARCYSCHGALRQESGLRLDTGQLIRTGGDSGAAVQPGSGNDSLLFHRVTATDINDRMPPEGEPLSSEQITLLQRWIDAGADSPPDEQPESDPAAHWAFQPVQRPAVPGFTLHDPASTLRNPIDAFLQSRRQQADISPQPEADRLVLLRRLYLDLIGLPPTLEEIAACAADPADDWYERTAERLLLDPRHGERWARHWMDIWRYSDWWGLGAQLRNSQKNIWHWRDWIIESLNEDLPYDEMVRLMLAADELHPNDLSRLRATGYLARNYWLFNRPQWMEETVEHVSKGFLGLTMNCARCHDHKFDPLEQADYYRLRAFFEPYHVRVDMVPGETDLAVNGIPRVFDGLPEEPTWLYIRGDERNPDQSRVITPAVPAVLSPQPIPIIPVPLPADAWQPERRSWVIDNHLTAAAAAVQKAEFAQEQAVAAHDAAIQARDSFEPTAKPQPGKLLFADQFTALDDQRWQLLGGDWSLTPGVLAQRLDGKSRSALRYRGDVPDNFDVTARFTIRGGSQYRSVGLAFDTVLRESSPGEPEGLSEQNVYVSAQDNGPKIHAAHHEGGRWVYPAGAAVRGLPIALNHTYTLQLQVRGQLINATLDGIPVLAFDSPLPRRRGLLQLTVFDALVDLHEFVLRELPADLLLIPATTDPAASAPSRERLEAAVQQAELSLNVAAATLEAAQAELHSVTARAAAVREMWAAAAPTSATESALRVAAIHAERRLTVAAAQRALAVAKQQQATDAGKPDDAAKAVQAAEQTLEKTLVALDGDVKPEDTFTPFTGALWTPTRFFNSGKDDPEVTFQAISTGRRSALAKWITDRSNPLTARVAVNHIWTRHMGQPLVPTMFDLGRRGTPPAHPELLDWLASELMDSGWSMRHLHTLIVSSSAYRLHSSQAGNAAAVDRDGENQLYWRRLPIRLESQVIRDSLLSLSGTLDETRGGPPVPAAEQSASTRRSLYFFHSNNERNLFLSTFDEALVKDCYRREQSIVPQQALALANSELAFVAAERIAARITAAAAEDTAFAIAAFQLVTGISPQQDEVSASLQALQEWAALPDGSETAARMNLIRVLINHNDFVTLR